MAYAVADGPAGLEGIHTWGYAVLNSVVDAAGAWTALPKVVLTEIDGLYGLSEIDDLRDPRTGRIGEVTRPGFPRAKTGAYVGTIIASSRQELRSYCNTLRKILGSDRSYEYPVVIDPPPAIGGVSWTYTARVTGCDIPEKQEIGSGGQPTPWQRTLTLTFRMSDPRFYLIGGETANGLDADGASPANAHDVVVVNQGTAPTDPVFTGAVALHADVGIREITGGALLRFNPMPAAGALTVDFFNREAYVIDGSGNAWDISGDLDETVSNWWDAGFPGLVPGNNTLRMRGAGNWTVNWRSASW